MTDNHRLLQSTVALAEARIAAQPGNRLYERALTELRLIERSLDANARLPTEIYERQVLGLLCARELEGVDDAYCDSVYALLDAVRPS